MSHSGYEILVSERVYEGRRVSVRRDRLRDSGGREFTREVVEHPGAAVVVPVLPGGRLLLLRQYRHALDRVVVEVPAGTLEPGEDPRDCADRELTEETGYRAGKLSRLGIVYPSPGVLSEVMHLFVATDLAPGTAAPEPGEDLEPFEVPREEALEMIRDGRIRDGKTVIGIHLALGAVD